VSDLVVPALLFLVHSYVNQPSANCA